MSNDLIGAVLVGGQSSRMGRDKAEVLASGSPMLERVGAALATVTGHVVVLGPDRPGWESWPDGFHVEGPLAGIATALSRIASGDVLVVAVDHPYVRSETLQALASFDSDLPVVPVDQSGMRQVTCARYPHSIAEAAAEEAAGAGSIQTLLDRVSFQPVTPDQWSKWGEDGRSWFSVDSPEALTEAEARFGDE